MISFIDVDSFLLELIKKGYTQRSFARKIGISSPYMSQIINGSRNPGPKVAKKVCDGLSVCFDEIFL